MYGYWHSTSTFFAMYGYLYNPSTFCVCYVWIFLQHKYFFAMYGYSYKYFLGYVWILTWHKYVFLFVFLWIWTPQHTAILVHSLAMKIWKGMAHGIFNTSSRHDYLVQDITDTECWAQNSSTRIIIIFTNFKCQLLTNTLKNQTKTCYFIFHSYWQYWWYFLGSSSFDITGF